MSDLILYTSEDGQTRLQLRSDGKTVWRTQHEIAELFQTTKQNISIHTKNIFAEVQNKLLYAATRHTAAELIVSRADSATPNMALMTWSGSRVPVYAAKREAAIRTNLKGFGHGS